MNNINEDDLTPFEKEINKIRAKAECQIALLERLRQLAPDLPFSLSVSGDNQINVHTWGQGYLKALRTLRPLAVGPAKIGSIFPDDAEGLAGQVDWRLLMPDKYEIVIIARVKDYTPFLKTGQTCERRPLMYQIHCQ